MMKKRGFTIMELLVAMFILVIVFSFITILYVRGSRIRRTITAYNEVNETLTQMIDLIANGRKRFLGTDIPGLKYAHSFSTQTDTFLLEFVINDATEVETTIYKIEEGNLKLEKIENGNVKLDNVSLELNNKVSIEEGSGFEYYNYRNEKITPPITNPDEIVLIKITLIGKSKDPIMKNMAPLRIETFIRPRNKLSF